MTAKAQKSKLSARDRGRLLLITDNPAAIQQHLLEAAGLEIVGVVGGPAALVSLQRSRPHVAVASTNVKGISMRELARTLAHMQEAIPLMDIDHMKAINDHFGHPAGDDVIRHVANTLVEVSRGNDTAARLGGEEFALLLAGISEEKAAAAAERLRSILAEQGVEGVGRI